MTGGRPARAPIWTNYDLRAGFAFKGYPGMQKFGQKWSFTDTLSDPTKPKTYRFPILIGDQDTLTDTERSGGSHPDKGADGKTTRETYSDILYYYSLWVTKKDRVVRGLTDLNFAYDDGSVKTFKEVEPRFDEDFAAIPAWASGQDYNKPYSRLVPKP